MSRIKSGALDWILVRTRDGLACRACDAVQIAKHRLSSAQAHRRACKVRVFLQALEAEDHENPARVVLLAVEALDQVNKAIERRDRETLARIEKLIGALR